MRKLISGERLDCLVWLKFYKYFRLSPFLVFIGVPKKYIQFLSILHEIHKDFYRQIRWHYFNFLLRVKCSFQERFDFHFEFSTIFFVLCLKWSAVTWGCFIVGCSIFQIISKTGIFLGAIFLFRQVIWWQIYNRNNNVDGVLEK